MNAKIVHLTPKNPPESVPFRVICVVAFVFGCSILCCALDAIHASWDLCGS